MAFDFSFELVTPDGLKYQDEIYEVELPTRSGIISVLGGHQPLTTVIKPGVIVIHRNKDTSIEQMEYLATAGGFATIDGKRVRVLADTAERAEDIDELKAKEALARARELQEHSTDQVSLADAMALIEQNVARLKVAGLRRRKR